jgi:endonuclease I
LDRSFDNDKSIVDIYSEDPKTKDPYSFNKKSQQCGRYKGESDCYNREHIFPQSSFKKKYPMKSDFFHVFPTDGYVNNKRSSYPFGEVSKPKWVSANGSKLGKTSVGNYSGYVFEPIDEFKGDVARALLYFATRYEHKVKSFKHVMLDGSESQVYQDWVIELMLRWHRMDPVSSHEQNSNEVGFRFQGNRNPFIDHPEWVGRIWGNKASQSNQANNSISVIFSKNANKIK